MKFHDFSKIALRNEQFLHKSDYLSIYLSIYLSKLNSYNINCLHPPPQTPIFASITQQMRELSSKLELLSLLLFDVKNILLLLIISCLTFLFFSVPHSFSVSILAIIKLIKFFFKTNFLPMQSPYYYEGNKTSIFPVSLILYNNDWCVHICFFC